MYWIIETLTKEASYVELAEVARQNGIKVLQISGDFHLSDIAELQDQVGTVNGSIPIVELIEEHLPKCTIFNNDENFQCSVYYPHLGDLLFNDTYILLPFREVLRQRSWIEREFGRKEHLFVRPNSGDKTFKARLVEFRDLEKMSAFVSFEDELVLVSNPKTIQEEWRFVICEREIVAQSSYKASLVEGAPKGAFDKCLEVIQLEWQPNPVYCVDIAQDADGDFWVLELNGFSSAGLYASDKIQIVRKIRKLLEPSL